MQHLSKKSPCNPLFWPKTFPGGSKKWSNILWAIFVIRLIKPLGKTFLTRKKRFDKIFFLFSELQGLGFFSVLICNRRKGQIMVIPTNRPTVQIQCNLPLRRLENRRQRLGQQTTVRYQLSDQTTVRSDNCKIRQLSVGTTVRSDNCKIRQLSVGTAVSGPTVSGNCKCFPGTETTVRSYSFRADNCKILQFQGGQL